MVTGVVGKAAVTLAGQPHRPYIYAFQFPEYCPGECRVGGEMASESRGRPPSHRRPPQNEHVRRRNADGGAPAIVEAPGERPAASCGGESFVGKFSLSPLGQPTHCLVPGREKAGGTRWLVDAKEKAGDEPIYLAGPQQSYPRASARRRKYRSVQVWCSSRTDSSDFRTARLVPVPSSGKRASDCTEHEKYEADNSQNPPNSYQDSNVENITKD